MTAPNKAPFPLQQPWLGIPSHVVLLHDLWTKVRLIYPQVSIAHRSIEEIEVPDAIRSVPKCAGPAWDLLLERKLVELVHFLAPTGESPCEEFEVHAITDLGVALLRAYGW